MSEPDRSYLGKGGIFIGVCALIGFILFLFDQGRSIMDRMAAPSAPPTGLAPTPAASPPEAMAANQLASGAAPIYAEGGPVSTNEAAAGAEPMARSESSPLDIRASTFVSDYYNTASGDAATAISWMGTHYAGTVDFFGKQTGRASLIAQKQAYLERWPRRSYRLDPGSAANSCNPVSAICQMSGTINFEASSPERGATSRGSASFEMSADFSGTTPLILRETSRVISRE